MKILGISVVIATLMAASAAVGYAARPSAKAGSGAPRYVLETMVPKQFAQWRELPESGAQVVNPQTQELLNKLYSQILTRTYVNAAGYKVMLSLAYGDDQRADLSAHKPEVCYPSQGFQLHSNTEGELATPFGNIAVRRLSTSLGSRKEPVTYWFTVGDRAIRSKIEQRIVEVRLGLTGQIPDGLLFRISSIDEVPDHGYAEQNKFVADLMSAVGPRDRIRLAGLAPAAPGS